MWYFYPRPPRGGRRGKMRQNEAFFFLAHLNIATPPHRAARHQATPPLTGRQEHFYPRPPRGGRPVDRDRISLTEAFLSTPSARRATVLFLGLHR